MPDDVGKLLRDAGPWMGTALVICFVQVGVIAKIKSKRWRIG